MTWDWEVYQSEIPAPEALGELRFFCRKSVRENDEQIGEHIREQNSECRGGCPYNFGIVLSFLGTFLKRYPAGSFKDRLASKPEKKAYQF
jgi:hypothetical protein